MDIKKIESLLKAAAEAGLSELEIAEDSFHLVLSRDTNTATSDSPTATSAADTETFKSPLAGIFYTASELGAAPFVEAGSEIDANASLCVIEAMKALNTITAPRAGRIVRVLAKDGESVDISTPLFEVSWST
ncbi:acetyl-CoA carboxylase biotin carboxyl carrier protein [Halomonas sp. H2]|uniref:acetyl-CoA carboxylase biotin carboxyl carrier protein n=1 Tax=Halomonas sp. H2 TaxID=261936 RepID=UPI003CEB4667